MTNKPITQKQYEKVAEWLNMYAVVNKDHQFPEQYRGFEWFIHWLHSAEGREAIRKELLSIDKLKAVQSREGEWFIVELLPWDREGFEGEGKTIEEALIRAVLAMLEGREG